jgi:hypothetical protein
VVNIVKIPRPTLFLFAQLFSGTLSPLTKTTPLFLLTNFRLKKISKFNLASIIIVLSFLRLTFPVEAHLDYTLYLFLFAICSAVAYANIDHLSSDKMVEFIKLYILFVALIYIICQFVPIEILKTLRSAFVNKYYFDEPHILRRAAIYSEPSDVGMFMLVAYTILWPTLDKLKLKAIYLLCLALFAYCSKSPIVYSIFLLVACYELLPGFILSKPLYFVMLALLIGVSYAIGPTILYLVVLDPADGSRIVFFYLSLLDGLQPIWKIPMNFVPDYDPVLSNSNFVGFHAIFSEFRTYGNVKPNAFGLYLLSTFGLIGWLPIFYYFRRLFQISDARKLGLYFSTGVFLMFIQSPVLVPMLFLLLHKENSRV